MKLGSFETENNIFAAPIAGVTDSVYRAILKSMGAGLLYTEMVSAKALCYNDKNTAALMRISDSERPVGVQLFGSEPEIMARGAEIVCGSTNADFIDINMGCPVPKVAGNGEGSALLKNPQKAGEIMSAVVKASAVPVTAKIRIGWDESSINAVETAKILESCGAAAIAVHGRTRAQYYSGEADRDVIREVKNAVKIPVIGNGDIFSPQSAEEMFNKTGCDAVMLARGILGNPWLVKRCVHFFKSGEILPPPTFREIADMAVYHTKQLVFACGEASGIKKARSHLTWYVKGQRGAAAAKCRLTQAASVSEIEEIFDRWYDELFNEKH